MRNGVSCVRELVLDGTQYVVYTQMFSFLHKVTEPIVFC